MINSDNLVDYLQKKIKDLISENGLKVNIEFHNEFSRTNNNNDIDIVIKSFEGTIANNRMVQPIQILAEVKESFVNFLMEILNKFTIENNETIFTLDTIDTRIKQFYSTPTILDNFNQNGAYISSTISLNASFIIYEGAIFLEDTHFKINDVLLEGVINVSYNNIRSSDLVVSKNNPIGKNFTNAIQIALVVNLDFIKNNDLHRKILNDAEKMVVYHIEYNDGYSIKNFNMEIASINTLLERGGTLGGQITFRTTGGQTNAS